MTTRPDDLADFVDGPSGPKGRRGRGLNPWSVLGVVLVLGLLAALLMPASRSARPAARRSQCVSNLKQIALALSEYEAAHGSLPPARTSDAAGRPLHSWRTLILPYLDGRELYDSIDLSKPWDDPANARALAAEVSAYRCPEQRGPGNATSYLAVVDRGGCFPPDGARKSGEITDQRGRTLLVIEVPADRAVPWMRPIDADEALVLGIGPRSGLNHAGGMNAAFVDGSVRFLKAALPPERWRALISAAGGDDPAASLEN